MVDKVIEIDTYGRIAAITAKADKEAQHNTYETKGTGWPAIAFFDFAAAFPSVAWIYLWLCMKYAGLPMAYVKAFEKVLK